MARARKTTLLSRMFGSCLAPNPTEQEAPQESKCVRVRGGGTLKPPASMSECSTDFSLEGLYELGAIARETGQHRLADNGKLVITK